MGWVRRSTRLGAVEDLLAKVSVDLVGERARTLVLLERVEATEKAGERLESTIKLLRNEWEDVLDRTNRVMGRLNARIRKSEAQTEPESDVQEGPKGVAPTGTHAVLSGMRRSRGVLSG